MMPLRRLWSVMLTLQLSGLIPASWAACPDAAITPRFKLSRTGDMAYDHDIRAIWMRCSYGQNWLAAGAQCQGEPYRATGKEVADLLIEARVRGWVLPTRAQLAALYDRSCEPARSNNAAFPASPAGAFWTSEALSQWSAGQPPESALVDFSAGNAKAAGGAYYVRLLLMPGSQEAKAAGITTP